MANYQDFSCMLANGNFQDQCQNEKQAALSVVKKIFQSKLGFSNGDIFKSVDEESVGLKTQNRAEFDSQDFFPNHRSENSAESPTQPSSEKIQSQIQIQSSCEQRKKQKKNDNGTIKNIIGNITKKSIKIMLTSKRHANYIRKKCKKLQINYKEFENYFTQILKTIYGPQSIVNLFKINGDSLDQVKMKGILEEIFIKIVRKRYPIYLLKLGKMRDSDKYIQIKNKKLLYFPEQIKNVMTMPGV